jgi:hypothetical protein
VNTQNDWKEKNSVSLEKLKKRTMGYGLLMIAFGILYVVKPDIYRRWPWKKTDIAQRLLAPEKYIRLMRFLGVLFIVIGIIIAIFYR